MLSWTSSAMEKLKWRERAKGEAGSRREASSPVVLPAGAIPVKAAGVAAHMAGTLHAQVGSGQPCRFSGSFCAPASFGIRDLHALRVYSFVSGC